MSGNWKDAYEAQMDLFKWTRSSVGKDQMFSACDYDTIHERSRPMLRQLIMAEANKLLTAEPFFVAAEFSDLIDAATYTFKPEPLLAQDFLASQGFLYYERPLLIPTRNPAVDSELVGFSWMPIMFHKEEHWEKEGAIKERPFLQGDALTIDNEQMISGGVALTLYERINPERVEGAHTYIEYPDGERHQLPPIIPIHVTPWYFGMSFEGNEVDVNDVPTAAASWWKPCQVTLRLMQQKLAQRHGTQVERASRRRGERLGFKPREVVIVRLRRHKSAPTGEERNVNWSHRWIVHGGWQWRRHGAGRTLRRQVWIGDYVKGPEDKPLLPKGRAFQWEE